MYTTHSKQDEDSQLHYLILVALANWPHQSSARGAALGTMLGVQRKPADYGSRTVVHHPPDARRLQNLSRMPLSPPSTIDPTGDFFYRHGHLCSSWFAPDVIYSNVQNLTTNSYMATKAIIMHIIREVTS
jgi:hypothetical protein